MKRKVATVLFSFLFPLFSSVGVLSQTAFPKPSGFVNDFANVLDPGSRAEFERIVRDTQQQTSAEIAVVTVPSLGGMPVEEYASRLFKEWGIGGEKQDNGLLLLVAMDSRDIRIEVGYGLEGVIPDGLAGEIIRNDITPRFREKDFAGGIRAALIRLSALVRANHVLTPEERARFDESDDVPAMFLIPFLGLFVAIGFMMIGAGVRTKTGVPLLFGALFGGMPLLMALAATTLVASVTLVPLAVLLSVVGYRLGGRPSWRDSFRKSGGKKGGGSGGGWIMGGTSGSGGSGGSSGGGSFSGGSSGGGGASGKW